MSSYECWKEFVDVDGMLEGPGSSITKLRNSKPSSSSGTMPGRTNVALAFEWLRLSVGIELLDEADDL